MCVFIIFPKQGPNKEGDVLNRVAFLGHFLSQAGSAFQTLSRNPTPKQGSSDPTPPPPHRVIWPGELLEVSRNRPMNAVNYELLLYGQECFSGK